MLVVSPYDRSALKEIERTIQASDLGLNPSNDGEVIRVMFPELTQERRRQFVRLTKERAEEGRTAVRNVRRHAKSEIDRMARDGDVPEDEARRADKALQELTDKHIGSIDQLVATKEKELLEV
jgi:ribosome recycling factor